MGRYIACRLTKISSLSPRFHPTIMSLSISAAADSSGSSDFEDHLRLALSGDMNTVEVRKVDYHVLIIICEFQSVFSRLWLIHRPSFDDWKKKNASAISKLPILRCSSHAQQGIRPVSKSNKKSRRWAVLFSFSSILSWIF